MTFLFPWALVGLLAAAVPILLHLVQRKEPPTITFPAVRYLQDATREHQRRLRLQHWLLLLVRTLLIAALVLAAAGPSVPRSNVATHAPSALVLILDNSASSGAVVGGTSRLDGLAAAARAVLGRATPSDALWLMTADGIPRRGDPATLGSLLDSIAPSPRRLDLGAALRAADDVLAGESLQGEIVLVSDLQRTALSAADVASPLTVVRPEDASPRNVGLASLLPASQPWSSDGGLVTIGITGDSGAQAPLAISLDGRPPRQALATAGSSVPIVIPGASAGWRPLVATIEPDELRLDDRRVGAVRVAPLARADCTPAGRYAAAACAVLESNGRLLAGRDLVLGGFGTTGSIIQPPEDPATLGALNRELARRGSSWRYGEVRGGGTTDSSGVLGRTRIARRLELVSSQSGRSGVLVTAGGAPWLVRDGTLLLLGSRLDTAWTDLPLTTGFVPFVDLMLNRLARGEFSTIDVPAGDAVTLPDAATTVIQGTRSWPVEGGARFAAPDTGLYFLVEGSDTIGAMAANIDPRESLLARATDRDVRSLWRGARLVSLDDAAGAAFSAGAQSDLRGPLLWLALLLGLAEIALASAGGRRT